MAQPRPGLSVAIAAVFLGLLFLNLCIPEPRGPADNGAFARVFSDFSSGPRGLSYSPSARDPDYGDRFFRYYHRFWRLDAPPRHARRSSTRLLFVPGRFAAAISGSADFDLAANTAALAVLASLAVWLALRGLRSGAAFLALSLVVLTLADAGPSSYLNSFYQEAGVWFFHVLLLCALFLFWQRPGWRELVVLLAAASLLMTAKRMYETSVALALAAPILGARIGRDGREERRLPPTGVGAAGLLACALVSSWLLRVPEFDRYNSFNLVFDAVLPALEPEDRPAFLRDLGLPPELVSLSGKSAFELGVDLTHHPAYPHLGGSLRARAIARVLLHHPGTFLRLFSEGIAATGGYEVPYLGYRSKTESLARQGPGAIRPWTWLRSRLLSGWPAYGVGVLLCLLLLTVRRPGIPDPGRWRAFFRLGSLGFFVASLSQVGVAALGEGPVEMVKLLYFANLLFDVHLLLALCGLASSLGWIRIPEGLPDDSLAGRVERVPERGERLALLSLRVGVPAARQVSGEGPGAGEIFFLDEESRHHSGDFADLDVLEAELAKQPFVLSLFGGRYQLVSGRRGVEVSLLQIGVAPQGFVEVADRLRREARLARGRRREEPSEEAVELPVVPLEDLAERSAGQTSQGVFAGARRSSSRPSTGCRTSASGAPASNP